MERAVFLRCRHSTFTGIRHRIIAAGALPRALGLVELSEGKDVGLEGAAFQWTVGSDRHRDRGVRRKVLLD